VGKGGAAERMSFLAYKVILGEETIERSPQRRVSPLGPSLKSLLYIKGLGDFFMSKKGAPASKSASKKLPFSYHSD
jgi:hypothetical protein